MADIGLPPDISLTENDFLNGRVRLLQPRNGYRAGVDAVCLAASIPVVAGERVLELGAGTGAVLACLLARVAGVEATGLEVQPDYAAIARENLRRMSGGGVIITGDLTDMPSCLRDQVFDHVCANPPFFANGSAAKDTGKHKAHHAEVALDGWIDAGLRRLRPGGSFTMIHLAERLPEILAGLGERAGDIRILPITARTGRPAGRVIVQGRKGRRGPAALLAPLVLHEGAAHVSDGDDFSDAANQILRHGRALSLDPNAPRSVHTNAQ